MPLRTSNNLAFSQSVSQNDPSPRLTGCVILNTSMFSREEKWSQEWVCWRGPAIIEPIDSSHSRLRAPRNTWSIFLPHDYIKSILALSFHLNVCLSYDPYSWHLPVSTPLFMLYDMPLHFRGLMKGLLQANGRSVPSERSLLSWRSKHTRIQYFLTFFSRIWLCTSNSNIRTWSSTVNISITGLRMQTEKQSCKLQWPFRMSLMYLIVCNTIIRLQTFKHTCNT